MSVVGLSGSGKSTAIAGAQERLAQVGLTSAAFHDRKGAPECLPIDKLIHTTPLSPESRMYIIVGLRRQVIQACIEPSLEEDDVTFTDRYYPCSIAYQAYGEGLNRDMVRATALQGVEGFMPSRIFFLDIPPALAIARMALRGEAPQIFDEEAEPFHARVRQGYQDQAKESETFYTVDGTLSKQRVADIMAGVILNDWGLAVPEGWDRA